MNLWGSDIDIPRKTACWSNLGQSHGLGRFSLCSPHPIHTQDAEVIISSRYKNINTQSNGDLLKATKNLDF